jgi:hypothetical protein
MTPLRRAAVAATLSFLIPGAGLWWLGQRRFAVINLLVATVVVGAFWLLLGGALSEHSHYVGLLAAAASAGFAHSFALHMTAETIDATSSMSDNACPLK